MKNKKLLKNQKGQGLIEYLIIVAIIGVASMAIMRTVGGNMKVKYADIVDSLSGNEQAANNARRTFSVDRESIQKSDMSNFMKGSIGNSSSNNGGSSGGGSGGR